MDFNQLGALFNSQHIINLFFKAFAIFFAFFYLFYAVIISRQTGTMIKTLQVKEGGIIAFISFLEIIFAIILILLTLFYI